MGFLDGCGGERMGFGDVREVAADSEDLVV